jgi:hypothetical protein
VVSQAPGSLIGFQLFDDEIAVSREPFRKFAILFVDSHFIRMIVKGQDRCAAGADFEVPQ